MAVAFASGLRAKRLFARSSNFDRQAVGRKPVVDLHPHEAADDRLVDITGNRDDRHLRKTRLLQSFEGIDIETIPLVDVDHGDIGKFYIRRLVFQFRYPALELAKIELALSGKAR